MRLLQIMQYMNVYLWSLVCRSFYLISKTIEGMSVKFDVKES
jgi:hypothetical protein